MILAAFIARLAFGAHAQPVRTLVIGDGRWSYSWRRVQENALDGFDRRQVVHLN